MRSFRGRRTIAFTLMELMVVITIIFVLMGLVLFGARNVDYSARRSRTTTEIAALSTALESYKIDNGTVPTSTGTFPNSSTSVDPTGADYLTGAQLLFSALSGRTSYDVGPVSGGPKSYYPFKKNQVSAGSPTAAVDAWGNNYGYNPSSTNNFNAPFYDLWSTSNGKESDKKKQWIGNWKTD